MRLDEAPEIIWDETVLSQDALGLSLRQVAGGIEEVGGPKGDRRLDEGLGADRTAPAPRYGFTRYDDEGAEDEKEPPAPISKAPSSAMPTLRLG